MPEFTLVIGSRNYSPWSLRAWILMKHLGVPFREVQLRQDAPDFKEAVGHYSPSGRVPALRHGELTVWDSLAIAEYLAETCGRGWPADAVSRALARWYMAAALEDAHMQQWVRAAQDEPWINATYEVGSKASDN